MKTVKVAIDKTKWYPVYSFASYDIYDFIVEIPENKYKWLKTTFKEFNEAQSYLRGLEADKNKKDGKNRFMQLI